MRAMFRMPAATVIGIFRQEIGWLHLIVPLSAGRYISFDLN